MRMTDPSSSLSKHVSYELQWRIQDAPPLFLHQTEARRAEKNFFETGPLPFVRVWMTRPPPFVRVWMTGPPLPPLYKGLVPPLKTTDYSETEKVTL